MNQSTDSPKKQKIVNFFSFISIMELIILGNYRFVFLYQGLFHDFLSLRGMLDL